MLVEGFDGSGDSGVDAVEDRVEGLLPKNVASYESLDQTGNKVLRLMNVLPSCRHSFGVGISHEVVNDLVACRNVSQQLFVVFHLFECGSVRGDIG